MKLRFFDFEVLPNWWLCVFGDYPDDGIVTEKMKENMVYVTSDDYDARGKLISLLTEDNIVLVGYNIKRYDLIIANAIYQGFSANLVKIVSDLIINPGNMFLSKEHTMMYPFAKKRFNGSVYQDLMDDNDGSLKEKEAILGLDIRESDVSFEKEDLTEHDKAELIYYCKHDVYATAYFHSVVTKGYVSNKLIIGKKFGIPENECYMCTNAKLVGKALGAKKCSFKETGEDNINIVPKVKNYIYDNLPNDIVERVRTSTSSFNVTMFDNKVSFGNGGLHSVISNDCYVASNDEWVLRNVDAASYYPSMLIQFALLSRCVKNPDVFKDIFDERIMLKHKPNKTQDEEDSQLANKLVLNTTFGASGNKYLELYDPFMCTSTCRMGQLFLAALANKAYKTIPGLKVIQSNTDGILMELRRNDVPLLEKLMEEWSTISGINMETDKVDKIWQRDVNNYLLVMENGKVKRKGLWLMDTWTKPGYFLISPLTAYVCKRAAINWLVSRKDIVESIVENTNLQDFAITCKKGPTFNRVVQRMNDGTEVQLYKCNRVIASKNNSLGQIYKIKKYKGQESYHKMPSIPDNCRLINKALDSYDFKEVKKDLDYMWYIQSACELLDIDWLPIGVAANNTDLSKFKYDD